MLANSEDHVKCNYLKNNYELPNLKEAVTCCDVNSQCDCVSGNVYASVTPHQVRSKLKKPVCSLLCMCALVGFILVEW